MAKTLLAGISTNIILLGIVSFLTDISSEMMLPLLPTYIILLGGTGIIIGLIGGLGESLTSFIQIFSGYISDRVGKRKPFIGFGYATSSLAKFGLAFSAIWQHILILIPLERTGKGIRTAPRDALIADSAHPRVRGKAFGFHRALDTSGAVLGSLFAFLFIWTLKDEVGAGDIRGVFLIAASIALLALIPIFFVKESKRPREEKKPAISLKMLPKSFRIYLSISAVFALANFTYMFFLLRAGQFFDDSHAKITMPILFYLWSNIVYAIGSIPSGVLSDRIGRRKVLTGGYLLFSLTCFGFGYTQQSTLSLLILFGLYGLVNALVVGTQRAFAADFVDEKLRATTLGAFHTVIGATAFASSLIAGILWEFDVHLTFIYGAFLALLAAVLFSVFKPDTTELT